MKERVVVVGSGVAGLTAALAAAEAGRSVTVLERADDLGGTSAISGGVAWLPGNHLMPEVDPPGAAMAYLSALAQGDSDETMLATFVAEAARIGEWIEAATPLTWMPIPYPDYHQQMPGARSAGRAVEPAPTAIAPEVAARIKPSPHTRAPVTYGEGMTGAVDATEIARRAEAGMLTMGQALIGALVSRLLELDVELQTGARVERLRHEQGVVTGVVVGSQHYRARVVLATGGFDREPSLVRSFLRGPMDAPAGAGTLTGDGLRMAMSVGADLGNMSEAWWMPAMAVPGAEIDGVALHRLLLTERAMPGSLMVDRTGRRFTNETQNYNDLGRELQAFDAASFSHARLPCWLVVDARFRQRYGLGPLRPGSDDPPWLATAPTPGELAERIGVPPDALAATIDRFNEHAASGEDPDFGRGVSAYDRGIGDPDAAHPNLAPLTEGPYSAVEVRLGCLGTKGGPRTDDRGRVADVLGGTIRGLYAVGNAAASPFGLAYAGAGGTIGPALVFGARAGEAAASEEG
ncbi:MAG: FAD-dependent oxidoreductase [Actinomycetota bacterium]